jgi:hypothetical protein
MMRCLGSYFDATRMWRRTERATLEKKPSTRLSQELCLGMKINLEAGRLVAWRAKFWFLWRCARNDCEDQLDRGASRIGGIKKLEEFDELSAAMAVFDEGVDLPGEQIDPCQQTERAMAFVLIVTRE